MRSFCGQGEGGTPTLRGDPRCVCSTHSRVPTYHVHCPPHSVCPPIISPASSLCPHVSSCPPSHIFLGFSKCGRYVLSYTRSYGDDDFSYLYHLYWWEFNVHSKMRLVGDTPGHPGTPRDTAGDSLPTHGPPRCARCGSSRTSRSTVTFT